MLEALITVSLLVLAPAYAMWARRGRNGKRQVLVPAAMALLAGVAAVMAWPRGAFGRLGSLPTDDALMALVAAALAVVAVPAAAAAVAALLTLPYRGPIRDQDSLRARLGARLVPLLIAAVILMLRGPAAARHIEASWEEGVLALRGPATWLFVGAAVVVVASLVAGWLGSRRDAALMAAAAVLALAGVGVMTWREANPMPADLEAHLWRRGQCEYFRFEKTYSAEEKAHVIDALCSGLDEQRRELQARYERYRRTRLAIDALPTIGY